VEAKVKRPCETVIVMPTLDTVSAARVAEEARKTAGIECGLVIASDYKKRGAVPASNVLVHAAMDWGARYICYLNDDLSGFQQGWLKRLVEALESGANYGSASAGGKCRGGPQKDCRPGLPPGIIETKHPLAWFCTVIRRQVLEQIGDFDEGMIHYADESDFQFRMVQQGWINVYVQDVYVEHHTGSPILDWWKHDVGILAKRYHL